MSLYDQRAFAAMMTLTENYALSHATTGNGRVDLFYKTIRGLTPEQLTLYLEAAWREGPLDTLKLIFFIRDCRGAGKGEKKLFYDAVTWLRQHHPKQVIANMKHIPFYGYVKDFFSCFAGVKPAKKVPGLASKKKEINFERAMLSELVGMLGNDWETIQLGSTPSASGAGKEEADASSSVDTTPVSKKKLPAISLAWKWTPTEGTSIDRKFHLVTKICAMLAITKKEYRQRAKTARAILNVVEQLMCAKRWKEIDFSKVSSQAMQRYKKCFAKQQATRWAKYLKQVQKGEAKMNVGQLMPHDIVSQYILHGSAHIEKLDAGIEASWAAYKKHMDASVQFRGNVLTVLDMSGSMFTGDGMPAKVGMALALTCSHVCKGKFHGKFIPFSRTARFVDITGETLRDQLECLVKAGEVQNTDFQAVFNLILQSYQLWSVAPADQITRLFVITDGQFDIMTNNSSKTNFEAIDQKFADAGYVRPEIVFWNVRANTIDFPVTAGQTGVSLVSGYSANIMKLFLEDGDLSPYGIVRIAIDNPRYDRITIVPE